MGCSTTIHPCVRAYAVHNNKNNKCAFVGYVTPIHACNHLSRLFFLFFLFFSLRKKGGYVCVPAHAIHTRFVHRRKLTAGGDVRAPIMVCPSHSCILGIDRTEGLEKEKTKEKTEKDKIKEVSYGTYSISLLPTDQKKEAGSRSSEVSGSEQPPFSDP